MNQFFNLKKSCRVTFTVTLFCFLTIACSTTKQSSDSTVSPNQPASINEVTISLWQQASSNTTKNVWLSPVSVSLCMRPLYEGAKGDTRKELATLMCDYTAPASGQLQIANALFVIPSLTLKKDYVKQCQNQGLEIYKEPITASLVNKWATEHTNGKINKILEDPIRSGIKLIAANAIYFKGEWLNEFNPRATREDTFFLAQSQTTIVPVMHLTAYMNYLNTNDIQAVTLYYTSKNDSDSQQKYAMTVVLPKVGTDLNTVLQQATAETLTEWMSRSERKRVSLSLPKLKIQYDRELTDDLKAMGVQKAFNAGGADFSLMSNTPLCIDMVKQSSFLNLDEKGTEAAAVTVAALRATSARHQDDPIEMNVNRPYLLILQDYNNHTPLFVGTIYNPNN